MIIILGLILVLIFSQPNQSCGIKCFSFSCKHNRGGRCIRKNITIYDNTVTGLCLFHTENMTKRILEPMRKIRVIEKGKGNPQMIGRIMKAQEDIKDAELVKNPKAFTKWLRKQGIGNSAR